MYIEVKDDYNSRHKNIHFNEITTIGRTPFKMGGAAEKFEATQFTLPDGMYTYIMD